MPLCSICTHEQVKEINRALLGGQPIKAVAARFGLARWRVKDHRRKHLPWRSPKQAPGLTVDEQMADLKLELRRLQALAECGESPSTVTQALKVVRQRQSLLELEARMAGKLDATHRKLILAARPPEGNFRVEFVNGRPRTVPVEGGEG